MGQASIDENLRVVFSKAALGSTIPALPCQTLFAKQIEREANGESDSDFYTKTYGKSDDYDWLCPAMFEPYDLVSEVSSNIRASVVQCNIGKLQDSSYNHDSCLSAEQTLQDWDNNVYTMYVQTTSTNFVPS